MNTCEKLTGWTSPKDGTGVRAANALLSMLLVGSLPTVVCQVGGPMHQNRRRVAELDDHGLTFMIIWPFLTFLPMTARGLSRNAGLLPDHTPVSMGGNAIVFPERGIVCGGNASSGTMH